MKTYTCTGLIRLAETRTYKKNKEESTKTYEMRIDVRGWGIICIDQSIVNESTSKGPKDKYRKSEKNLTVKLYIGRYALYRVVLEDMVMENGRSEEQTFHRKEDQT